MTISRLTLWIVALAFTMFVQVTYGADKQTCRPELSSNFATMLAGIYPHHRVLVLSDLSFDDQHIWETAYPGICPGLVMGRFSDAGEQVAVILVPDNVSSVDTKVVLIDLGQRSSKPREVFSERKVGNLPVLRRGEPGVYENVSTGQHIRSKHDVLLVEHLEATVTALVMRGARVLIVKIAD